MIHCTLLSHIGLVHVIDWVKMAALIVVFQDFQRYFFFKTDNKFCRTELKAKVQTKTAGHKTVSADT